MSVQTEQFLQITKLILCMDGGAGNTTLSAAHSAGATTINVVSSTGLLVGDPFRVGEGEDAEVHVVLTVPNGTSVTVASPGLKRDHVSGDVVVEQVADEIGPITEAGFRLSLTREAVEQFIASQRLPFAIIKGYGAAKGSFELAALTLYNMALAMGQARSTVLGALSASDPLALTVDGSQFGTLQNAALIVEGELNNQTPLRVEMYGLAFDYTGIQMQLRRGAPSTVPVKVLAGGGAIMSTTASPWTGTTTYLATNGDVLDGLDDFGYFAAHGTPAATTVASGGAAGANTVVLASGAGYAPGDWVKFGSGNTVEFHQVHGVSTDTLTLRSRFLRAQAVGTAVTRQALTQLASINTDGVTLALGGVVTEVRSGLRPLAVGYRPGTASLDVNFALTRFVLATFALATGKAIPGGTELNWLTGLGQTTIDGFYATGTMQSGKRLWANTWGIDMDLSGLEVAFTNSGEPPVVPLKGKPLSGLQLLVYPS